MKQILTLFAALSFSLSFAQTTTVPDPSFEQALIDLGYDAGMVDGSVPTDNIDTITSLDISNKEIIDLTGIRNFASLMYLDCNNNQISRLDLSNNSNLEYLMCYDNVLSSLDVTKNLGLKILSCYNNSLAHLDVSRNSNLIELSCDNNQLTSLDVAQNSYLEYLSCGSNQITDLDLTQNTNLEILLCYLNKINALDLSQNINLNTFDCWGNQLNCLNVKNGNNINFQFFYVNNNPNLTCIEVDDPTLSENNWYDENYFKIDSIVSFSTNCGNSCFTNIDEIEQKVIRTYPLPVKDELNVSIFNVAWEYKSLRIEIVDVAGKLVQKQHVEYDSSFEPNKTFKLQVKDVIPGVYFLQIWDANTGETISSQKVVKI